MRAMRGDSKAGNPLTLSLVVEVLPVSVVRVKQVQLTVAIVSRMGVSCRLINISHR
jgi:hypothetical protein